MGDLLQLALYNPAILKDEDFLAGFVARRELVDDILVPMRGITRRSLAKHRLILGQRGMGKTSLLRRIALGVRDDQKLSKVLLPLTFREEQYNVHNLHTFWCNCLDALGDFFERTGQYDKAQALDQEVVALTRPRGDGKSQEEGEAALTALKGWAKREGKRLLLMLDNIDLILDGLTKQQWSLRRTLQEAGGIVVIGAASAYLEATADPQGAFYDFFQVTVLERLGQDELLACLRRLAEVRGTEGSKVLQVLNADPGRIRTLYDLTGGNPRTLVLLYLLLERDAGGDVMSDLERLLDQVTVLYKSRVEDLAPQARVVLDALALAWNPIIAADLSTATGMETPAVSSQLDRLLKDGVVEKVSVSRSSRAAFQLGERFFNIWYLMRHGPRRQRTRLRWLTGFLRGFYSPRQLTDKAMALLKRQDPSSHSQGHYCLALSEAVEDEGLRNLLGQEARRELDGLATDFGKRLEELVDPEELPTPQTAKEWFAVGRLLHLELERFAEAEAAYRCATAIDPQFGRPWNNLGILLSDHLGRYDEAEAAYRRAIEIDPKDAWPWGNLGDLLTNHLGRHEEAEAAYRRAIEIDPKDSAPWYNLASLLSDHLGRDDEAETAYRRAIEIDPKDSAPWYNLANLLSDHLGRHEEAEAAYRRAIEINPEDSAPWNNLANLLTDCLGRPDEAEAAYLRAIEIDPQDPLYWRNLGNVLTDCLGRHEEAEAAYLRAIEIDPQSVWSWTGLGNLLSNRLGRYDEAEVAYRHATEIDPKASAPWNNLANLLADHLSRHEEAEIAYRRAIEIDPKDALYWRNLGNLLKNRLGRYDEAEVAYRRAIETDPEYAIPWNGLGVLLSDHLGRYEEAEAAYRRAIEIDSKYSAPWNNLADLLTDHLSRHNEAEIAYRRAIELDTEGTDPWIDLGDLLANRLGRYEEAEAAYRRAIEIDPKVAWPWIDLGDLLVHHFGRHEEAEAIFHHAIEIDPENNSAWDFLGYVSLYFLEKPEEAESAYQTALQLEPDDLVAASNLLAIHLFQPNRQAETEAEFETIVPKHPPDGASLLRTIRALARDRLDDASATFKDALLSKREGVFGDYTGFYMLVLRLVAGHGFGDKWLAWMEEQGLADRYWPLWTAFDAYLHGEERLLDVNPEVRGAAKHIYDLLDSARRARGESLKKESLPEKTRKKRKPQSSRSIVKKAVTPKT